MNQPTQDTFIGDACVGPAITMPSKVRVGRRASDHKETKIELTKNGSTIEAIHITCACGETIVVNCIYPDDVK